MGDGPVTSLERDMTAWLQTVAADNDDTLRQHPSSTIVPMAREASAGGRRAIALLERLGHLGLGSSAQLRTRETIGEGGMGIVRLAEQVALGRLVAVKTLKADRRDEANTLDLLREAWVTGSVEHPNVVPVHSIGLDEDGSPLIVLKRIEGVDWSQLIADADAVRERFDAEDLLAWNLGILGQVLNAVRLAHSKGIVHRDIKPENVMIGTFGEVYLVDWGIAVSLVDDESGRMPLASQATEMAGTPCYMAPEMLGADHAVPLSERTDVYLAGAVLYELISGQPPHLGDSALEIITSVATSRPAMPAHAPPELARICQRAMAPAPEDRHASADELQRELTQYLQHRGSSELAHKAMEGLEELLGVIAEPADDAPGKRERVYRIFGACRFGFHEAMSTWRDNPDAHEGLRRAVCAVARFELEDGDPRSAVSLLTQLHDPPAALVEQARAAADERKRRDAELAELERGLDWTIGTRTRTFIAGLLGTVFTLLPLTIMALGEGDNLVSYGRGVAVSCSLLFLIVLLGIWARESMMKTRVNRKVFATTLFVPLGQLVMFAGLYLAEISARIALFMMMFYWFVLALMFVIGVDRRLWPCAVGYLIAFLTTGAWPEYQLHLMAAGNFVFCCNAVWAWRPSTLRWNDLERAERGLPPRQ